MRGQSKSPLLSIVKILLMFIKIVLFIPVQIVFIPFAITGLITALYKETGRSRKLGVSFSAGQSLQYRWVLHYFNLRKDLQTIEFIKKYPCESHFGLWTVYGPLIISQKFFGLHTSLGKLPEPGKETLTSTAGARVVLFDSIMAKYIDRVDQVVIPGAGFDLINLHFTEGKNITVFELDQSNTIRVKVETLKKSGIKHNWINFIAVDYSKESWSEKLIEAGFDKNKSTIFLWQSVSLFLEEEKVRNTLKEMAALSSKDSIIVQDFYSETFAAGKYSGIASKPRSMMEKMGEPWKFGIDMSVNPEEAVKSFLNECGLNMSVIHLFGEKLKIKPFYCIAEAEKK